MPGKSDINPATGHEYARNPSTGHWDDTYWAEQVEPGLRAQYGSPAQAAPQTSQGFNAGDFGGIAKQAQQMYTQAIQPQVKALQGQKPGIESRYQTLLKDVTRLSTRATAQEFGRRGIPIQNSGLYEQELARAIEPQQLQAAQLRSGELQNLQSAIAALQSGAMTGGIGAAQNIYGMQQQAGQQAAQLAQQQQQFQATQAAQTAQQAWEQPWQEKMWQSQLDKPYYKPTTGGAGTDLTWLQGILNPGGVGTDEPKPTWKPGGQSIYGQNQSYAYPSFGIAP